MDDYRERKMCCAVRFYKGDDTYELGRHIILMIGQYTVSQSVLKINPDKC